MTNLTSTVPKRSEAVFCLAILAVLIAISAPPSAWAYSPQRDGAAISTLQSAITALGGSNAIAGIQDCIITGSIVNQNNSNNFTWTIAGNEFRIETTTAKGGTNVFLSGHGSPAWVLNGSVSALNSFVARATLPFYLPPYVLFQELNNPIYTLRYVGSVQLNGRNVLQVHVSDDSDPVGTLVTAQEWYFDAISFLPVRVQARVPANENSSNYGTATYDISLFVAVNNILVPNSISYSDDTNSEVFSIGMVTFNSGVPQNVFDPTEGGN